MFRFENLEVWRLAFAYGKRCYMISRTFPTYEKYGLGDQLRRAALSVSNNIAEGSAGSKANFIKYTNTAIGSAFETVNIIVFAAEVGYLKSDVKEDIYLEAETLVKKMTSFRNPLLN